MSKFFTFFIFIGVNLFAQTQYQLTIITSLYKADFYVQHFLEEIAKQTIYPQSQHIIINANSPGHEENVILPFVKDHDNVEYIRLEKDPGLYAVWNIGIKKAKADYLVNANLDDRLAPNAYELLLGELKKHPEIDLVYSEAYITSVPNQSFGNHQYKFYYTAPEFSHEALLKGCFIGSHPIWRKSMHDRYGLFNEKFSCAGDWEMWLRASSKGSKFKHVKALTGLNFLGPETLTNSKKLVAKRKWENDYLHARYGIK